MAIPQPPISGRGCVKHNSEETIPYFHHGQSMKHSRNLKTSNARNDGRGNSVAQERTARVQNISCKTATGPTCLKHEIETIGLHNSKAFHMVHSGLVSSSCSIRHCVFQCVPVRRAFPTCVSVARASPTCFPTCVSIPQRALKNSFQGNRTGTAVLCLSKALLRSGHVFFLWQLLLGPPFPSSQAT